MSVVNLPGEPMNDWSSELPRQIWRIGIVGLFLMFGALGGFGYWAFSAPLAAAVVSQGSFVATGRNKVIQHFEGGIIKDIIASEGDAVQAGDTLITLDTTPSFTKLTELTLRKARLDAMVTRLKAQYGNDTQLTFASALRTQAITDIGLADILDSQSQSFELSRDKLENELQLLNSNISAQELRIWGYEEQSKALDDQMALLNEDLAAKRELFSSGLTRKTEINALQRALVDARGQKARLAAEIGESESMIGKYRKQALQIRHAYSQEALDELQAAQAELDSINEQILSAEDVLRRTEITAPVSGTVFRMHYHTSGGVIKGGQEIAEILPMDAPLIIETLIPRTEIDSVQIGQHAFVRLTALNQRTTPVLDGEVFYLSADAVHNAADATNPEVYIARINITPESIAKVPRFVPTPGMPVEILIATEERTFFQYLTKPIVDSMSRAFRED
ncbi:HlyD family type I secretion periplasmic adaptor subunit [Cognatishimia sp. SS12]|uniref:HlyD family type I secretion periplasmic adaptor subunit n=1 Tax=Cognatishimia sp. SS12 TaxID=2979465 RepID=UPI00233027F1|nr:HlyD family type I secretion periplasmic adaptor subunit [Cognatishimia sp. SS12]MDC0739495.1 HlyD family type I secretion periplasmic adaptor subunit [Cognatishimia sp. SS12]